MKTSILSSPPLTTKIRKNLYLFCLSIKSESEVLFSVDLCNNSSHTTLLTYCLLITHATTGVPSDVQYKVTSGLHIHKNLYVTSVLPNNYKYGEFWWIPILLNDIRWPLVSVLIYKIIIRVHWFRTLDDLWPPNRYPPWSPYCLYSGWLLLNAHLVKEGDI